MASHPKDLLTPEEYLAIERRSEFKSEYFAGETFAMAGGSKRHNLVAGNINRILGTQLLERDCNVYNSDMRVKIASVGKYTYPDASVACADEQFEDEDEDTLLNPIVIIEVLSKSTEAYDRGKKWSIINVSNRFAIICWLVRPHIGSSNSLGSEAALGAIRSMFLNQT
jgi:Uma2 family endonuclease